MKKKGVILITIIFLMIIIPTTQVLGYGGTFNFNLRFQTDNDNSQNDAYRSNMISIDRAYVYVLSKSNAAGNVKFKVLSKDNQGHIRGQASTTEKTYTSAYLKNGMEFRYKTEYLALYGTYSLYGHCTKSDCNVSGQWSP